MPAGPQEVEPGTQKCPDPPFLTTDCSLLDLAGIMDVDSFWVLTSCSFLHHNKILEEGSDLPSLGQTPACMGRILLQVVAVGDFPEEEQ